MKTLDPMANDLTTDSAMRCVVCGAQIAAGQTCVLIAGPRLLAMHTTCAPRYSTIEQLRREHAHDAHTTLAAGCPLCAQIVARGQSGQSGPDSEEPA